MTKYSEPQQKIVDRLKLKKYKNFGSIKTSVLEDYEVFAQTGVWLCSPPPYFPICPGGGWNAATGVPGMPCSPTYGYCSS